MASKWPNGSSSRSSVPSAHPVNEGDQRRRPADPSNPRNVQQEADERARQREEQRTREKKALIVENKQRFKKEFQGEFIARSMYLEGQEEDEDPNIDLKEEALKTTKSLFTISFWKEVFNAMVLFACVLVLFGQNLLVLNLFNEITVSQASYQLTMLLIPLAYSEVFELDWAVLYIKELRFVRAQVREAHCRSGAACACSGSLSSSSWSCCSARWTSTRSTTSRC